MEDTTLIRSKAAQWMADRGWRQLVAKRRGFEQSLFEHTDVELNALLTLLPILSSPAHYNLSELEQQAMIIGQIAHDVGKEVLEWQEYVKRGHGKGPWVTHIYPQLTAVVVPELVRLFGFSEAMINDACTFVNVHMKAHRTPTSMLMQVFEGGKNDRWQLLASLVDTLDNICSASGLFETLTALGKSPFARHLTVSYHLVQMRGVSTTLLHGAALDSFVATGWSPLLHFSVGTIYASGSEQQLSEPGRDQIEKTLASRLEDALPESFERVVVGRPLATLLPKPEFFDYRELPAYLQRAKRTVRRGSFAKKPLEGRQGRREKVKSYWQLCGRSGVPTASHIEEQTQRIDRAQPEIVVFKFFKAAVSKSLVCREGLALPDEVLAKLDAELAQVQAAGKEKDIERAQTRYAKEVVKAQDEQWQRVEAELRQRYDEVFGSDGFAALQSTSTLMPAKDLAFTVDRFWSLPGDRFGLAVSRVEDAPDEVRERILVDTLNSIAQRLYESLDISSRPTRASTHDMAQHFIADLQYPRDTYNSVAEIGSDQLSAYQRGKDNAKRPPKNAGKAGVSLLCPICNDLYHGGTTGKADFLPKPESHTNRAPAHGRPGNIVICETCKFERFLLQLLLGEQAGDVLVLLPHMNVGQLTGTTIMQRAQQVRETAEELMSTGSARLDEHLTLQLTNLIYDKIRGLDLYRLSMEELLRAITYRPRDDTLRGYRKELEKQLRDLTETPADSTDVTLLNELTGEAFASWDDALDQIMAGRVMNDIIDPVVRVAFKMHPPFNIVCQTPNMILMPINGSFAVGKDGETNAALRQLFIMLLLGLALDCSVDVVRAGDPILFGGGEGIARVPPVPAIRELAGLEWIMLDQAPVWLSAIGAAALLASDTAYPERSNVYQILTASTPGHILRRIEQKSGGNVSSRQIKLIDQVKEVLHA